MGVAAGVLHSCGAAEGSAEAGGGGAAAEEEGGSGQHGGGREDGTGRRPRSEGLAAILKEKMKVGILVPVLVFMWTLLKILGKQTIGCTPT